MRRLFAAVFALALLTAARTAAAGGDDILGLWNNQEKDARIEILTCGEKYCGTIVWMKDPNYPDGSTEGQPGTPKLDNNNPDRGLRARPRLGLEIVRSFEYAGDNRWTGGKVYDPKNGKTYSGKLTLATPTQLNLRGFIGISLIGRTSVWTR